MTPMEQKLVKALKIALMEFERISYQKKADPEVINLLKLAISKAEANVVTVTS